MPVTINQTTALGNVGPPSYGQLYEDGAGSTITVTTAGTFYGWTTASAGLTAGAGFVVADTSNATADRLTVGSSGAGTYLVTFSVSYSGTANRTAHWTIFKDGVAQGNVSFERKLGTGGDVGSGSCQGMLALVSGNYLDARVTSDNNGDLVVVNHASLTINRVG